MKFSTIQNKLAVPWKAKITEFVEIPDSLKIFLFENWVTQFLFI